MKIIKQGGHRLFEIRSGDVPDRLGDAPGPGAPRHGRGAQIQREVRRLEPATRFELTDAQIGQVIAESLSQQVIDDTEYCQANVRAFAEAQLADDAPLEVEIRPGVTLGHRHIPVNSVGSYIPGGRYPMFGSAQMSIIPAKVAGVKTVVACTPPVKGEGYYPGDDQRDARRPARIGSSSSAAFPRWR